VGLKTVGYKIRKSSRTRQREDTNVSNYSHHHILKDVTLINDIQTKEILVAAYSAEMQVKAQDTHMKLSLER